MSRSGSGTRSLTYFSSAAAAAAKEKKRKEKGVVKKEVSKFGQKYYTNVDSSLESVVRMIPDSASAYRFLKSFIAMSNVNAEASSRDEGDIIYANVANPVQPILTSSLDQSPPPTPIPTPKLEEAEGNDLFSSLFFKSSIAKPVPFVRSASGDGKSNYSSIECHEIVTRYAKEFLGIDEEDISVYLGHGVLDMYYHIMSQISLNSNSKDTLIFTPCFGYLFTMLASVNMRPLIYETRLENDWDITRDDVERIAKMLRENQDLKTIVANYPNNPTGKIMTREMARNILRGIVKSGRKDMIRIFSDEITGPLTLGEESNFSLGAIGELLKEAEFRDAVINLEVYVGFSYSKIISANDRCAFLIKNRIAHNCKRGEDEKDLMANFSGPPREIQQKYTQVMSDFIEQKNCIKDQLSFFNIDTSGGAFSSYSLKPIQDECRKRIDSVKSCTKKLNARISEVLSESSKEVDVKEGYVQDIQYVKPYIPGNKDNAYPESGNVILLDFSGLRKVIKELKDADDVVNFLFQNANVVLTSGGAFCSHDLLDNSMVRMTIRSSYTIEKIFDRIADCVERAITHGLNEDLTIKPSTHSNRRLSETKSVSSLNSDSGACIVS